MARPRHHLIRFHGVLACNTKLRALVEPQESEVPAQAGPSTECVVNCAHHRPVRLSWAKLLKRVFEIDMAHFDRSSSHASGAKFQLGFVDADEARVNVPLAAIAINVERKPTQVLLSKFAREMAQPAVAQTELGVSIERLQGIASAVAALGGLCGASRAPLQAQPPLHLLAHAPKRCRAGRLAKSSVGASQNRPGDNPQAANCTG